MKELENMEDEKIENKLLKTCKDLRKVKTLEQLPLIKWSKDRLLDVLINFDLLKLAKSLKSISLEDFIKYGEYKNFETDFEEYKTIEETEEIKELRSCTILRNLPFAEWSRLELLDLLMEYNLYIFTSKTVGKDIKKFPPIMVYAGTKYNGLGRNHLQQVIKRYS